MDFPFKVPKVSKKEKSGSFTKLKLVVPSLAIYGTGHAIEYFM